LIDYYKFNVNKFDKLIY